MLCCALHVVQNLPKVRVNIASPDFGEVYDFPFQFVLIQSLIAFSSYVCPSPATAGSIIASCVMGQTISSSNDEVAEICC